MFETANLKIDSQTLNRAYLYAQAHNMDLSAVIEAFLLQFSMGKIKDVRKIRVLGVNYIVLIFVPDFAEPPVWISNK